MPRKSPRPKVSKAKDERDKQYPRRFTRDTCPDRDKFHTDMPVGYIERAEWVLAHLATHAQSQCPTCGLWCVWTPLEIDEGGTDA